MLTKFESLKKPTTHNNQTGTGKFSQMAQRSLGRASGECKQPQALKEQIFHSPCGNSFPQFWGMSYGEGLKETS